MLATGNNRNAGGIFDRVANYLELYILASMDDDRVHFQILNHGDPCCFDGASRRHEVYDDVVAEHVNDMGDGTFRVVVDPNTQHSISSFARQQMMNVLDGFVIAEGTIRDNGDSGYSQTGSWQPWTGLGYRGDVAQAAAGNGDRSADWEFEVPSGIYAVSTTWPAHTNRALRRTVRDLRCHS